jgi:hypothetical protein
MLTRGIVIPFLENGTVPTRASRNQTTIGITICNAKRLGDPISQLENHLHFGCI